MRAMRPTAKAAAVLVLCSGLAFLGFWAGGEHRPAKARRQHRLRGYFKVPMPQYPGVKEYPLTRKTNVGSSSTRMSYFVTNDDPLKIARFYADRWRIQKHHVSEDVTLTGGFVSSLAKYSTFRKKC